MAGNDDYIEVNIKLSSSVAAEMQTLAAEEGHSLQDLVRYGLAFMHLALQEGKKNHTFALLDENGVRLKDIEIPRSPRQTVVQKILGENHSSSLARAIADLDPDTQHGQTR